MHKIYCGGFSLHQSDKNTNSISLNVEGKEPNINLKINDISRSLVTNIPFELLDLMEIAAYVYCADQKIKRGGAVLQKMGEQWTRQLHFYIPVRCLEKWQSPELNTAIKDCLEFLSDDIYTFDFSQKATDLKQEQTYLSFSDENNNVSFDPDEICLFSGGLDSCAGAVEDIIANKKKLVLVSHYSSAKVLDVQKTLIQELKNRGYKKQILHIPVEVNKINIEKDTVEYTQRTRSFLFASLAITIANLFNRTKICFYENGVVSLNLPASNDVLGSRATRTTHPKVLRGFERIFSLLLQKSIVIDTPLQWLTKHETVALLQKNNVADFIGKTNSCTRPHKWTKEHTHCGVCSQCIDRRFSILAANLDEHDPQTQYGCDLMLGSRDKGEDIVMAANFVAFAQDISEMSLNIFQKKFPQLFDALSFYKESEPLPKIYAMLKRHAVSVNAVIQKTIKQNAEIMAGGRLPPKSLLSIVATGAKEIQISEPKDTTQELADFMDKLSIVPCEFVIDEDSKQVIFAGGLILDGTEYTLIKILLPNFLAAKKGSTEAKTIQSDTLIKEIYVHNEDSFRKMVSRVNKKISEKAGVSMGVTFGTKDFIENIHGKGYRINKVARLLSSVSDLMMPEFDLVTK